MNPSESRQPLRRSWVVVIEEDGKRELRMRWAARLENKCLVQNVRMR